VSFLCGGMVQGGYCHDSRDSDACGCVEVLENAWMCMALAMEVHGNSLVVVRGLNMAIGVRGGVSEAWSRWRCSLEARFGLGLV